MKSLKRKGIAMQGKKRKAMDIMDAIDEEEDSQGIGSDDKNNMHSKNVEDKDCTVESLMPRFSCLELLQFFMAVHETKS